MNAYYSHRKYLNEELNHLDYRNPVNVLEFGTGDGSASIFQSFAKQYPNLRIDSYESDFNWLKNTFAKYAASNYHFHHVDSWDKLILNGEYDLAFVDNGPDFEARIKVINLIKNSTKVIILHDYDFYNKGIMEDHYCVGEGSFFGERFGNDFILQGNNEYPGTLIMRNKTYNKDHFIFNMLKHVTGKTGIYVEAGANDGVIQSYTHELEKIGWHGILIEPSKEAFDKCVKNRPGNKLFNCALVASEDIKEVSGDFFGSLLASVGGVRLSERNNTTEKSVVVKSRTLNSILEESGIESIDLLSLDVEGYELEVLKGFDLFKYHPEYVIIEVYDKIQDDIFNFMTENNYVILDNLTGLNHKDHPFWDGTHNDYLFKRI